MKAVKKHKGGLVFYPRVLCGKRLVKGNMAFSDNEVTCRNCLRIINSEDKNLTRKPIDDLLVQAREDAGYGPDEIV